MLHHEVPTSGGLQDHKATDRADWPHPRPPHTHTPTTYQVEARYEHPFHSVRPSGRGCTHPGGYSGTISMHADGASASVHALLSTMVKDGADAFLVPVPQYPLYSAALTLYGGTLLPYYLDEAHAWGINVDGVERQIAEARARGLRVRGVVVINPGNPTGQVLPLENQVCPPLWPCPAAGALSRIEDMLPRSV